MEATNIGEPNINCWYWNYYQQKFNQHFPTKIYRKYFTTRTYEWANPVGTPLDHNVQIEPNPDGNQGSRSNSCVLLRELQWVANVTQPDIAYAINKLTTYTTNPSLQHVGILKCILCYLAGTRILV